MEIYYGNISNRGELAIALSRINQAKQESIEGYERFLSDLKVCKNLEIGGVELVEVIDEVESIISDELNHSLKITKLQNKLSGVSAPEPEVEQLMMPEVLELFDLEKPVRRGGKR